jgi:hypothetical protein
VVIRRAFFYWQFAASVVLPLWLVVGWQVFGAGGWKVLGVFLGAVVLGLALLVIGLLFYARREVRDARAVSWPDVGVLSLWHALIIGVGFYAAASPWLSVLVIVVGIGAFWFALWELFHAAKRRVQAVIDEIETAAKPAYLRTTRPDDPNVIVITERPEGS